MWHWAIKCVQTTNSLQHISTVHLPIIPTEIKMTAIINSFIYINTSNQPYMVKRQNTKNFPLEGCGVTLVTDNMECEKKGL